MKRHFEYYTQPEGATLKDRSRFWTWYMRGLHGDMDTRYEGDRRLARERAAALGPKTSTENGFNFRPLASNTYGYHPKGVSHLSKPAAAPETTVDLDNPRKDWSTPLKNLDDLMLMRDNEPPCDSARRRPLPSSAALRRQALDDELDGLLTSDASELRIPLPNDVREAQQSLDRLRRIVGFVKPYDSQAQRALHSLDMTLMKASRTTHKTTRFQ